MQRDQGLWTQDRRGQDRAGGQRTDRVDGLLHRAGQTIPAKAPKLSEGDLAQLETVPKTQGEIMIQQAHHKNYAALTVRERSYAWKWSPPHYGAGSTLRSRLRSQPHHHNVLHFFSAERVRRIRGERKAGGAPVVTAVVELPERLYPQRHGALAGLVEFHRPSVEFSFHLLPANGRLQMVEAGGVEDGRLA